MAALSFEQFLKKAGGAQKDVQIISPTIEQPQLSTLDRAGGVAVGAGKGLAESAVETSALLQDIGQRILAGADPTKTLDEIRQQTGFKSLQGEQLAGIREMLEAKTPEEIAGKGIALIGELLAGGGADILRRGITKIPALPLSKAGQILKTLGEKTTGLVTKMEEPTKIALQAYQAEQPSLLGRVKNFFTGITPEIGTKTAPITEAGTSVRLLEPGTEWQIGVDAKRVSKQLWDNTIAPALRTSENVNDMKTFLGNLREKIITTTADLDRRKVLLKAWQSFAEDYKNVRTFSDVKLQQYKEGWARFVPEKTYKGEPIAAASKEVRSLAADQARKTLYNILPDGAAKQAYIDYGNLQSIKEAGIKSVEGLTDKSFTRKIYEAIIDKAVTPVATISGKILYKTGNGLEFIGNKGAKKVKDIVK